MMRVLKPLQDKATTGAGKRLVLPEPRRVRLLIRGEGSVSAGAVTIECYPESTARGTQASPLFEIASVLVRFDHLTSNLVNANHKLSEKPKSHLAATALACDGRRDVDSVCSAFNGAMNRGDGLLGPASGQSIELFH